MSPTDTGRVQWGHFDFSRYDRPTMCHRALDEATRHYVRIYRKDTLFAPIVKQSAPIPDLPKAAVQTASACIAHLDMDSQSSDQLWAIARIYLVLGELEKSKLTSEKAISISPDEEERLELKVQALRMYLDHSESTLPLAYHFANIIRSSYLSEAENARRGYMCDILFMGYFSARWNIDSVMRYISSAKDNFIKMSEDDKGKVTTWPFQYELLIANAKGDIDQHEKILQEASSIITSTLGSSVIASEYNKLDVKKSTYQVSLNLFNEGLWYNSDGVSRPQQGKSTLIVIVNHNCGIISCGNRIRAIQRLKNTFAEKLDVVLVTSTMGYALGTGPLTPAEEGMEAAKYFKDILELPHPLLVDESPTYKLPDGRILRDKGPVTQRMADMFAGENQAIITEQDGKVKWIGGLASEDDVRLLADIIERALIKSVR